MRSNTPAPAPADKAVIQRLVRASRRGLPLQAIADHVDDPADHASVADTRQATRLRKQRLDATHLELSGYARRGRYTAVAEMIELRRAMAMLKRAARRTIAAVW
jgi:hypothetical protein